MAKENIYNPLDHSAVQACFGSWYEYECDDFISALLSYILDKVKMVHWNVYQHEWSPDWHGDKVEDPEIPGIQFTRYYDSCSCPDENDGIHLDECRHSKPNFSFNGVGIKWYKYPGRGMSTNKDYNPYEWKEWFNVCLEKVREFDNSHCRTNEEEMKRREVIEEFWTRHGLYDPD